MDLISAARSANSGELRIFFFFPSLQKSISCLKKKKRKKALYLCQQGQLSAKLRVGFEKCVTDGFSFSLSISLLSPSFQDSMVYSHMSFIFVHFLQLCSSLFTRIQAYTF